MIARIPTVGIRPVALEITVPVVIETRRRRSLEPPQMDLGKMRRDRIR
jgi:hypothetical protein